MVDKILLNSRPSFSEDLEFEFDRSESRTPPPETPSTFQTKISPAKGTPKKIEKQVRKLREIYYDPDHIGASILPGKVSSKLPGILQEIDERTPPEAKADMIRKFYMEPLSRMEYANKTYTTEGEGPSAKRRCIGVDQQTIELNIDRSWLNGLLIDLKKMHERSRSPDDKEVPMLVNQTHITEMDDKGFHLCPSEKKALVRTVVENTLTGIWYGTFQAAKKEKGSTFFPCSWTFNDLLKVMSEAEIIAKNPQGRALLDLPGYEFKAEALMSHGGVVAWSCYPIWYYISYDAKATYNIFPSISYSAEQIKQAGMDSAAENCIYQLKNGDKIIDIAPRLPNSPIDRGVYIRFSPGNLDKA